jgi:glycosyltransferase involved in cell wall biosynthesis
MHRMEGGSRPLATRIGIIIDEISPYLTPVFERIARRPDCELLVVYETAMEPSRSWGREPRPAFQHEVLQSWPLDLASLAIGTGFKARGDTYLYVPKHPLAALSRFAPDVVIASGAGIWSSPADVAALAARSWHGWAFVPWWGSFRRARATLARRIAEPLVRAFIRSSDAWMAYGTRSSAELERLGADPSRIVIAPLVGRQSLAPTQFPDRARPHDPFRFLFVGRLIERKGLDVLLSAFRGIDAAELWIVGEGPLLARAEAAAREDRRVRVLGHANATELGELYRLADALVVPSYYDVWGLVVNEAQAYGLPVIASDEVGAAADLIDPGVNGLIVPTGSSIALGRAMNELRHWAAAQRERSARRCLAKLAERSLDRACEAIVETSLIAREHRRRRHAAPS